MRSYQELVLTLVQRHGYASVCAAVEMAKPIAADPESDTTEVTLVVLIDFNRHGQKHQAGDTLTLPIADARPIWQANLVGTSDYPTRLRMVQTCGPGGQTRP